MTEEFSSPDNKLVAQRRNDDLLRGKIILIVSSHLISYQAPINRQFHSFFVMVYIDKAQLFLAVDGNIIE